MKRTLLVTVFAGAILLSMQVTQAQTAIYREVFGNNTAGNLAVNAVGWVGDYGATAQDSMTLSANNFGVSAQLNAPGGLPNINAPVELSQANGLLFTSGVAAGTTWIAYQNSYTPTVSSLGFALPSSRTVFGMPPPRCSPTVSTSLLPPISTSPRQQAAHNRKPSLGQPPRVLGTI
jgi:hypothetical protein